jgi:osmotically-inducible protein OsmY
MLTVMDIKSCVPNGVALALLLIGGASAIASASEPATAVNKSNVVPADATTPTTASQRPDDIRVTQQIRDALSADTAIAPDIKHMVNIATNSEAVVLTGALSSTSDISRVQTLAQQYAGARQVINELTVRD